MFTVQEKVLLVGALEMMIASHARAQKAAKFPDMEPIYERGIANLRSLIEKVKNAKAAS